MEEREQKTEVTINETGDDVGANTDYIAAINELKQNSVSKEQYEKLKTENKKLLDAIVNGDAEAAAQAAPKPVDIKQLRSELYGEDPLNNLEYVSKTLELRKAIMDKGEVDPFVPYGKQIAPTEEDFIKADKVAKIFQECVDYADGDSELFTNELMRRTNDAAPLAMRNKKMGRK